MQVTFKNEYGTLDFKGGGNKERLRLLKIEGLGLPKKEYNVTGYSGQPGQELISQKDLARTITLSADITPIQTTLQNEIKRMAKILYYPGELTIRSNGVRRSISCRCTSFDEPERFGKTIAKAVLQFVCDNPYFTDEEAETKSIYYVTNNIKGSFKLPMAFSSRLSRGNVINLGDADSEPKILLYTEVFVENPETYGINIINHTTGQSIKLEHYMQEGEEIIIDIPNRKITSNKKGDIISAMSKDTFLSNFWLGVGNNDIEVIDSAVGERISVVMEYNNKYLEAVY